MLLKDLIFKLQELYASYDEEYIEQAGEPEIMVDVFKRVPGDGHFFKYSGFGKHIVIEHSSDGVYPIISGFEETQLEADKKNVGESKPQLWLFPKSERNVDEID